MLHPIDFSPYVNIVVLTGAGISVASGIPPFRGPRGIWSDADVLKYATADAQARDPWGVWKFSAPLRDVLKAIEPNPAHDALAQLENSLREDQAFTLITQNIDGLHQRAGSQNVVEIHGCVNRTRCTNPRCRLRPHEDTDSRLDALPTCNLCGSPLRVDVVLFEEEIRPDIQRTMMRSLRRCDLFIAIGTSGSVYPAAGFVQIAKLAGAKTILVNLDANDSGESYFHEVYAGKAEEILPELLGFGLVLAQNQTSSVIPQYLKQ